MENGNGIMENGNGKMENGNGKMENGNGIMKKREEIQEVEKNIVATEKRSNIIQVSSSKRPIYFYVNLAKKYMQNNDEVELSALGMAIGTVVTVAEILKNNGLATEKKIRTSTVNSKDEAKDKLLRKAKIEITLEKSENFDKIMSPRKNDEKEAGDPEIEA